MLHQTFQNFHEVWVLNDFIHRDFDPTENVPSKNHGLANKNVHPFLLLDEAFLPYIEKTKIALN